MSSGGNNRKVFLIQGLDCANCASKIEKSIRAMDGIHEAVLDFINGKIILSTDEKDEDHLVSAIQEIADGIENGVTVSRTSGIRSGIYSKDNGRADSHRHGNKVARTVILLILGGILFLFGILFPSKESPIKLAFFVIAYLIVGGDVVLKALKNIRKGKVFDENFLISIATIGAFFIGEYPEAVAVMIFYQLGEMFQGIAVSSSRKSIAELMDLKQDFVNLKSGNGIMKVSPEEVNIGDTIIVRPGEKVPLDGRITEGYSVFDTSALTGESLPREIGKGAEILSGYINRTGLVTVKVERPLSESTVTKILDMVQNAASRKSKTENFITRFAAYYTPAVVIIAGVIAFIPPILSGSSVEGYSEWIYKGLVFLVLSCPCALVISIPLGFFGGIGGASRHGILIKGSNYLEGLNKVNTVVMDKTGTLTKGIFEISGIKVSEVAYTAEELLMYAAYAESYSSHPVAVSIVKRYEEGGAYIDKGLIEEYNELPGYGIKATVDGKKILAGNLKLMEMEKIYLKEEENKGTTVYVAVNGIYYGSISVADRIKEDSLYAVSGMKKNGIKKIVMLTGDKRQVSEEIARKLSIDEVYAELLPHEKVERLEEIFSQNKGKGKVMFVGDGINDAPVLARADIGVAMGGIGSDAAREAADVVIMNDEPSRIVTAIKIARKTRSIVWQNIILALGVKFVILVLGVEGSATMWEAVFADVGVALMAILNAMRIIRGKFD